MKKIIVGKDSSRIRLDKFLAKEFISLGITRGEIIRSIKSGNILVNNKQVKPSYKLRLGDAISSKLKVQSEKLIPNSNVRLRVIHKNENIIAVDKPAGLQVHPDQHEKKNTLINGLVVKFPEIKNIHDKSKDSYLRPGIVHRLDKDTSGVMVIARNINALDELKKLFKEHKVEKKYLALVYGKLKDKSGIISKPIARAGTYKKQVIAGRKTKTKIREAVTEYKVLKEFENCSLLKITPKTGRMHQIRVHLFSIGHPVIGDKLYKLKTKVQPFSGSRLNLEIKRQMLHAQILKFKLFNKKYLFKSPLPDDFLELVSS